MFGIIRQLRGEPAVTTKPSPAPINDPIVPKKPVNRRKVSGERVTCKCEFILPNPDPFMRAKMLVSGTIVLNVRGCCVYPDQAMSVEELKQKIPESKALDITKFMITGSDNKKFPMETVSVRRVRLLNDEHGQGVILRFSNLSEKQIEKLNQITELYAEPE